MTIGEVSIPLYEEQIQVGTRVVEAGSVRLRKQVTSETVNQPVQVRHETLVIDREAAPQGQTTPKEPQSSGSGTSTGLITTPFAQGEMLIRLFKEEPVVEKRIVPSGTIVAQTRTNMEQITVQREVRREKVDVEKIGNPQNVTISEKLNQRPNEAVGGTGTGSEQIKGGQKQEDQKQQEDRKAGEP
jgi:stress response protein YsnF